MFSFKVFGRAILVGDEITVELVVSLRQSEIKATGHRAGVAAFAESHANLLRWPPRPKSPGPCAPERHRIGPVLQKCWSFAAKTICALTEIGKQDGNFLLLLRRHEMP
jgi:hypothetical protein